MFCAALTIGVKRAQQLASSSSSTPKKEERWVVISAVVTLVVLPGGRRRDWRGRGGGRSNKAIREIPANGSIGVNRR